VETKKQGCCSEEEGKPASFNRQDNPEHNHKPLNETTHEHHEHHEHHDHHHAHNNHNNLHKPSSHEQHAHHHHNNKDEGSSNPKEGDLIFQRKLSSHNEDSLSTPLIKNEQRINPGITGEEVQGVEFSEKLNQKRTMSNDKIAPEGDFSNDDKTSNSLQAWRVEFMKNQPHDADFDERNFKKLISTKFQVASRIGFNQRHRELHKQIESY
jgi:hypothetical protein